MNKIIKRGEKEKQLGEKDKTNKIKKNDILPEETNTVKSNSIVSSKELFLNKAAITAHNLER